MVAQPSEQELLLEFFNVRDSVQLSDPCFKLREIGKGSLFAASFFDMRDRYLLALNHDIQMLRRLLRSLQVWDVVKNGHSGIEEGIGWACILIDFIEPTLRTVIDLPKEVKDKIVHASWKLSIIASEGLDGVKHVDELVSKSRNTSKYKLFEQYCIKSAQLERLDECLNKLFKKRLR